jgi:Ca2+-binding RTX toxin-like protein
VDEDLARTAAGVFGNIGGFTGLTDTGTAGEWVTIVTQVGSGFLVYTQQLVSQFLSSAANPGPGSDAANHRLVGTDGDDILCGDDRDNILVGKKGNDLVCGGAGNDVLQGTEGDDILDGGPGNHDRLYGGRGIDTCVNGKIRKGCEVID